MLISLINYSSPDGVELPPLSAAGCVASPEFDDGLELLLPELLAVVFSLLELLLFWLLLSFELSDDP